MKKICVITSTRAEYGLLKPVIIELKGHSNLTVQLIATGTHVDKRFGNTIDEILNDGLRPDFCVEIIQDDSKSGVLATMSNAVRKVGDAIEKLSPDLVVLLGDRYEIFAIASACVILNIPIAHIHGGEVTYGAYDDMFRHCITKMSNIHFASCEDYKNRIIQLGENPDTVFNFGALGAENIKTTNLISKEHLESDLGLDLDKTLLATFHPVTMENSSQLEQFKELLEALIEQNEYTTLFTKSNADTGASTLNNLLDKYTNKFPQKIKAVESLGMLKYLSVMKYCAAVIGNSSSGILETPSFKKPTINIGNRQRGRIQACSIINCEPKKEKILKAIAQISDSTFQNELKNVKSPYECENTAKNIANKLVEFVNKLNTAKEFYDLR